MPGLSFSELFTWKSKSDSEVIVVKPGGWILKAENFEAGEYSMPYSDDKVINAQLDKIRDVGPRRDLCCFYDRDRLLACVSGLSSLFALSITQKFFALRPWQYLMYAPPVFITPYIFSRYDQEVHVTQKVLLGNGERCPLCCIFRGGFGLVVTSALTNISLSSLLAYGVAFLFGDARKLPTPGDFNGLTRMGTKLLKSNRINFLTIVVANFTFGFCLSYLQVSGFHALHKADVHDAQRIEFERERKLE